MTMENSLLNAMDENVIRAVEKYGVALDVPSDEFAELVKSCSLNEKISIIQWIEVVNRCESLREDDFLINAIINSIICKMLPVDKFYQVLQKILKEVCLSMSKNPQNFALLLICNKKMPYAGDYLLSCSDEEYVQLTHSVEEQFNELVRIYDSDYPQKTQTSSAVLRILDSVEDAKQRSVLLSLWDNLLVTGGSTRQLA